MQDAIMDGLIVELKRGTLTLLILGSFDKPYYGYELLQILKEKNVDIEANTLYPLLRRLESQELLSSEWDTKEVRPRKYYTISHLGNQIFKALYKEWQQLNKTIEKIVKGEQQ